jgi:hypothetical protein
MAIKKSQITAPTLPEETVDVQELGGEIIVRGLLLKDKLSLSLRDDYGRVAAMLAVCVVDAERQPVFTEEQWEAYGAQHFSSAMNLWDIAQRLSGMNLEGAKKKLTAVPS